MSSCLRHSVCIHIQRRPAGSTPREADNVPAKFILRHEPLSDRSCIRVAIAERRTVRDPAEWWGGGLCLRSPQAHVYTWVCVVTSSGAFRKAYPKEGRVDGGSSHPGSSISVYGGPKTMTVDDPPYSVREFRGCMFTQSSRVGIKPRTLLLCLLDPPHVQSQLHHPEFRRRRG